jgi:hypothetical protein
VRKRVKLAGVKKRPAARATPDEFGFEGPADSTPPTSSTPRASAAAVRGGSGGGGGSRKPASAPKGPAGDEFGFEG